VQAFGLNAKARGKLALPEIAAFGNIEALADGDGYPRWWPQVREVRRIDDRTGTARFRSLVPYDLHLTVTEADRDAARGTLRITFSGDLEGWARWTVTARGAGTRALFEQDVVARKPLLRRFAVLGRALFRANHALMMRAGRRGLRARMLTRRPDRNPV